MTSAVCIGKQRLDVFERISGSRQQIINIKNLSKVFRLVIRSCREMCGLDKNIRGNIAEFYCQGQEAITVNFRKFRYKGKFYVVPSV